MKVKSYYKSELLSFYDLTEDQMKEALDRFDNEETSSQYNYWSKLPQNEWTPEYILNDTSEVMRHNDEYWHGSYVISNSLGCLVHITKDNDYIYVAYKFKESE